MTARRLLQIVPVPDALLDPTPDELAWALLEDMQAPEHDPITGMPNRDLLANSLTPFSFRPNPQPHEVMNRINKAGRDGFALLERWDLIEPTDDMNGRNGFVVLTTKGTGTTERTDVERVRARGLQPVFEAVSNSLHSVEDTFGSPQYLVSRHHRDRRCCRVGKNHSGE